MESVSSKLYSIGYNINNTTYDEVNNSKLIIFDFAWDTIYGDIIDKIPSTYNVDYFRIDLEWY